MAPAQHTLHVLTGLPGSGKSTHAARLVEQTGAFHLAMDDEVSARGGPGSEELAHAVVEGMAHLYEVPGAEEIATYDAFHHIRT